MKKVLIAIGSLVVLLLLAAVLIPIIFKDDIKAAVDKALAENLNAKVYYEPEGISLSLFKSFPDLTLSIDRFGISGNAPFEGDTLVNVKSFQVTVDIMSAIKGEEIEVVKVLLDEPIINVIVLEDGRANYDIAKSTETDPADTTTSESSMKIEFQGWEIRNGLVIYDDRSTPMLALVRGLNHKGSGDFGSEVFDMETSTTVDQLSFGFDGVEYITNKIFKADVTMAMDLAAMKFTFKENTFALNDFEMGMEGFISMPDENIDMEILVGGKEITLKSILSLVPGDYKSYLDGVSAEGLVSFQGEVKGTYNEKTMPKVKFDFAVDNGRIAYADYPIPMEKINIKASFDYPSADLRETSMIVEKFNMLVDGEAFSASLIFKDFEDYYWDLKANGGLDLEKITKIVPMEGMELKGLITTNLQTKGRMSDLKAERYEALATSGDMKLQNFQYISADLPQGFGISEANMTFNNKEIALTSFKGNAGKTDLNMDGKVTDYLQYVMSEEGTLKGELNFYSAGVYVDEWMSEEEAVEEDTSATEEVRIPENIDFVLASKIDLIKYDNLDMKDFKGKVIIRDGSLTMERVGFNLLDGYFELDGAYNTAVELPKPVYDFDFKIEHLSIPSAFESFNTVKKLAPFAEKMKGKFSTNFSVTGTMNTDMTPVYEAMQGKGNILVEEASLEDVKLLKAASKVTKLQSDDGSLQMDDVLLVTEIIDGRIYVEPFDVSLGGKKSTISGSSGVDGSLDFKMASTVPTGKAGDAVNSALSSLTGGKEIVGSDVELVMGIGGTYNDIQVKLLSANPVKGAASSAKAALKAEAKQQVDEAKAKAKEVVEEKKEEVKAVVEEKKEEVKKEVDEKKEEAVDKAKKKLKGIF